MPYEKVCMPPHFRGFLYDLSKLEILSLDDQLSHSMQMDPWLKQTANGRRLEAADRVLVLSSGGFGAARP